jgi:hypothetical protein
MHDHHKISLLVGAGAVAVLIYLLMQKAAAGGSNGSAVPDEAVQQPSTYPQNPAPIQLGNVDVSPVNINYNGLPPTLAVGDNTGGECGCDAYCDSAGQKVTVQTVPKNVLDSAQANYADYKSNVVSPKITLQQNGASFVQPSSVGNGGVVNFG